MIIYEANYVQAVNIDNAWREALCLCAKNGFDYKVRNSSKTDIGGSYIDQYRKQLPYVSIRITQPWLRPLAPILPPSVPPPTTDEKIEKYFAQYLAEDVVAENEDYTYGGYIKGQIPKTIERLNNSKGNTNQACIAVCDTQSVFLEDPPCLRSISFKNVNNKLNMTVFFRSWDLFVGLPENLGGLQMLKELVLSELDFDIEDGDLIANSDGLHLYDQYWDVVNTLNVSDDEKIVFKRNEEGAIV